MEKIILKVGGMSCEHCVKAVSKAVGDLSGVAKVSVDLKAGTAAVNFDPAKSSVTDIRAAIEEAGYTVS